MNTNEIARVLLNMSLDMDYMDSDDSIQETLAELTDGIEVLRNTHPSLAYALEIIAESYGNTTDLVSRMLEGVA